MGESQDERGGGIRYPLPPPLGFIFHITSSMYSLLYSTLLEKFWRISLYVTDDTIAELHVT